MRKRYLFFDYDGTLRSRAAGGIPQSAQMALECLRQQGHFVALATGRLQANALSLAEACGIDSLVADGGNSVTIHGQLMWMEPMELEPCKKFLRWLDTQGRCWAVTTANELICRTSSERFAELFSDFYLDTVIEPELTPESLEQVYKIYVPCKPGEEDDFQMFGVTFARYTDFAIYCEPTEKTVGIKRLIDILARQEREAGVPDDELPRYGDVVVFGDGSNDLSMFCDEWTCVAMGNAITELKDRADLVTTHIDDNGILNACQELGLL